MAIMGQFFIQKSNPLNSSGNIPSCTNPTPYPFRLHCHIPSRPVPSQINMCRVVRRFVNASSQRKTEPKAIE